MTIFETADGSHSMFSDTFGVAYHSKHGAIQETAHVFIKHGLFYTMAKGLTKINILDIGFGTGLNAFMTFLETLNSKIEIKYTAYEKYPITLEQAESLNYALQLNAAEYQTQFLSMHRLEWSQKHPLSCRFDFEKIKADFFDIQNAHTFDVIYFDAFAPQAQPELWGQDLLQKMYTALKPSGVLTTYCAQGQFKRNLKKVGFEVEALPGPPFKREMTRATKKH